VQFLFAGHTLDTDRRELRRGPESIAVEPQVFDLLIYLVENRDRVVSKDDLIASVWGGRIVSDSTLTSRVNAARKAVGDSGEDQKLIRTIARNATTNRQMAPDRGRMKSMSRRVLHCRCPTDPPSRCFPSPT